jgi:hypothetical protein
MVVTISQFLKDDNRNRAKPHSVEAADDAMSTTAVVSSSLVVPVHTRQLPSTAHVIKRRPMMPPKAPSQRSVVQKNRKSAGITWPSSRALSSNKAKRPAYQTSKTNSSFARAVMVVPHQHSPYPLEDEFPGVSRHGWCKENDSNHHAGDSSVHTFDYDLSCSTDDTSDCESFFN